MTEDQVTDISYDFAFPIRSQSLVEVIFTRNYYLQYLVTNNHGFDLEITFTVLFRRNNNIGTDLYKYEWY